MQHRRTVLSRPLAMAATVALGLGGFMVASPALAATSSDVAPVTGSAYEAKAKSLLSESGIEAVGKDANGNIVVVATGGKSNKNVKKFTDRYDNVVVKDIKDPAGKAPALEAYAGTDVVGGAGYFAPDSGDLTSGGSGGLCSVGFSAWTPTGGPAVISAGHCVNSGAPGEVTKTVTGLTLPSGDEAGGGNDTTIALTHALGTFGFHQFGGPGDTPGDPDNGTTDDIDVSVINVNNNGLSLLPKVTNWTTAASNDLSTAGTTITAVGKAQAGHSVSKSGRTTGLTSASNVTMIDGWANISGRAVYGFGSIGLHSDHGDSGGAVFQGSTAVGILSGGGIVDGNEFTWASDLQNDLAHTNGYTVKLQVAAPKLTSPANNGQVYVGRDISGTGPASTTIVVTPTSGAPFNVKTDSKGKWSFKAPDAVGAYPFTVQAKSGFNLSSVNTYSVNIAPAPLDAPKITSPKDGANVTTHLDAITGTGAANATVTLTGAVTGTTTVGDDGKWSVPADLGYGKDYKVSATQEMITSEQAARSKSLEALAASDPATSTFSVVPVAPKITSPENGSTFSADDAPASIAGTGVDGADIAVKVNNKAVGTAKVANGEWAIDLDKALASGKNTISVTETINGASASASATVTVEAAATTPTDPATDPGQGGGDSDGPSGSGDNPGNSGGNGSNPATGSNPSSQDPGDGQLVRTGTSTVGMSLALAALLLVGGAVGLVTYRKRRSI